MPRSRRQLGAQAVNEPRLDRAMLLAREAVNLDRSPQTEGTLLATLQRQPGGDRDVRAADQHGTTTGVAAPTVARSPSATLAPTDTDIAQGVSLGDVRFYDPRTQVVQERPLTDFSGAGPPVYSSDGSLLAYPTADIPPSIAVRDAHTLALMAKLTLDPLQIGRLTPDIAHASILISPDGRTVYCAYRVFDLGPTVANSARGHVPRSVVAAERAATVDHADRLERGTRVATDRRGDAVARRRCAECQRPRRELRFAT